jgi:hypothetical protein
MSAAALLCSAVLGTGSRTGEEAAAIRAVREPMCEVRAGRAVPRALDQLGGGAGLDSCCAAHWPSLRPLQAVVSEMHIEIHKHSLRRHGEDDVWETVRRHIRHGGGMGVVGSFSSIVPFSRRAAACWLHVWDTVRRHTNVRRSHDRALGLHGSILPPGRC